MASAAGGTEPGEGREEVQDQSSSLDWMLDSSHVNVGLWNHFDGQQLQAEEQGVHDREELPQQTSSLDRMLPSSHVDVDLLRRLDNRAVRAEEQGVGDRGAGPLGSLEDLGRVAHFQNTCAGPPTDNLLSLASGNTALSICEYPGRTIELSRSITDPFKYNHSVGRQVGRDGFGHYLDPFEATFYEYNSLDDGSVVTHHIVIDRPESLAVSGYESAPRHGNSSQRAHVMNQASTTKDQLLLPARSFSDAPLTYHSARSSENPFICQRCKVPQHFDREADLQRHMAASHPTRKVWITVDISSDKKFLANCKACRMGKRYGAYKNAAAHLRRVHFTPGKEFRDHKYGVSSGPTMKALMTWMQELEEDIDAEHQDSQLTVPVIRVLDASQSSADFHSSKNDLGPPRRGRQRASPLNASSLSTESEQKKRCTYQEAGRPTTHNRGTSTPDDQLLAPYPKRQKMASSHRSSDLGYTLDGMTHSNQLNGEDTSHWSKSTDDGELVIKSEFTDPDIDVIALIPKDESHHLAEKQTKEETSETPKSDTKPSRESECKGEDKSEYIYVKNEPEVVQRESKTPSSANKHPGQSQHCSEPYNLKRKRKTYSPPTFSVASGDSKSESIVDIDIEKGLANSKHHKADYTKVDVCTMKAEPNHAEVSLVTAGLQQPVISFNMEPSHPKHRSTVPLPFGHPKSRQWTEMLPSIKACTREIMGKGNKGALELFLVNEEPTICITCWDPLELNLALVRSCMGPLGLRINVAQGKIEKSANDEHDGSIGAAVSDQGQYMFSSSVHGHYMQRPTCGASLGTADGPSKSGKVSLGGYLKIKDLYRRHWSYYAMTVHHILVSGDQKEPSLFITGNNQDEEIAEPGYDYSHGVHNGLYDVEDGPGIRVTLSCPAVPDVRSLVARLEGRRIKRCANESYAAIDNLDNLDDLLNKVRTREGTSFGNAAWSSGLCLDQDVEMDWLLIGDLPVGRIGCNNPGDVTAYMEGSHQASIYKGCWTASAYVDESAFSTLMDFSAQEWGKPGSEGGYLSRVFGRGSETGLADGFLSPHPSIFYDETYGPYDAWAFTPRYTYGLGDSGDSGTWIFTSEGKLLGQIISYNRARHITYFTPICKIFNHIKRITGATDVELLTPADVAENPRVTPRSAGELLLPEEGTSNPNRYSTSTTTNIGSSVDSSAGPKRLLLLPKMPASSSQPLPLPFNHVLCSTAGLPMPGSTQTSESSD